MATLVEMIFLTDRVDMWTGSYVRQAASLVITLDVNSIFTYAATTAGRGALACNSSWTLLARPPLLSHKPYGLGKP
jgi:hypothetical protein